jgi:hypothetical protein
MNTFINLKPCPFCGGKPVVLGGGRNIHCGYEGCFMTSVWAKAETAELAAQCWNTRAPVSLADPGTTEYGSWINRARKDAHMTYSFHKDEFKWLCHFEQELRRLATSATGDPS